MMLPDYNLCKNMFLNVCNVQQKDVELPIEKIPLKTEDSFKKACMHYFFCFPLARGMHL
jgi:hypothetical protein